MPHSRRTRRLASEGAVIVVSILLAFWIDAWWDHRQARNSEVAILASIRGEVEENSLELDRLLELNRDQLDRIDRFFDASPEDLRPLPSDSVTPWLSALVITWTYDAEDAAAELFLGSSTPVTSRAREVRGVLARWVRIVEDTQEEKETVWELGVQLGGRLASYSTGVADQGPGLLHEVAGGLGPELLTRLRGDEEYVAALLTKASYQDVYLMELDQASALLDSLRVLVGDGAAWTRTSTR